MCAPLPFLTPRSPLSPTPDVLVLERACRQRQEEAGKEKYDVLEGWHESRGERAQLRATRRQDTEVCTDHDFHKTGPFFQVSS